MRIRSAADAREAARRFRERARQRRRAHHARRARDVAARPEQGWQDDEIELPAEAREVADVTGAGDTVISALALAAAAGASLADAARLANRAAGIVVGKFGPATVTVEELRQSTVKSSGLRASASAVFSRRCSDR